MILPSAYLPPVAYIRDIFHAESVTIDLGEHFVKQSPRTRCVITTPNGPATLSVPVSAPAGFDQLAHVPMSQVLVSYQHHWTHQHFQALQSAYGNAPYFLYFADFFRDIYNARPPLLADLNKRFLLLILQLLNIDTSKVSFTNSYQGSPLSFDTSSPSILDLLFELGPETRLHLQ